MKQYEVIKTFIDKNTKRKHKKGTKYKTDNNRATELKKKGFIIDVQVKKQVDKDESK